MPDLSDGESVSVKGSGSREYTLRNVGGVYSCSCPAWRNQGAAIEKRTCKHIKRYRGEDAEKERLGADFFKATRAKKKNDKDAPPLLLAEKWDNTEDLAGWWMSEKLDGVRAYWDTKGFQSRLGNPFHAPDWFVEGLPSDQPLDGELWIGRGEFQRTVSVVRRQDKSDHWKEVKFVVFDAPKLDKPFEDRTKELKKLVGKATKYAAVLAQERCKDIAHMEQKLAEVEAAGGEGLMMRKPKSNYEIGRSTTLLKVKTFHDAEAIVVKLVPGKGRHKGRMGALSVELEDGTKFSVGTGFSDAERRDPPAIGTIITFRYQELSNAGVPRFPSFVGVRDDVTFKRKKKAAKKTTQKKAAKKTTSQAKRYFELRDDKSQKFWEISCAGNEHTVRYGRIGANGQTKSKTFDDAAGAKAAAEKLIDAKVAKGYREV